MAWTIGSASEHGDPLPRSDARGTWRSAWRPALGAALALALLVALAQRPGSWPWLLSGLAGAALLASGIARMRAARPPAAGPRFAIEGLPDGPVEVVGRVVPPRKALLSPLTSTKCSYYDFSVRVFGAGGESVLVEERARRTDFVLKDVTGSIRVLGEGLDVRLPPQLDDDLRSHDQTPRAVAEHLAKLGIDLFVSPGVRRAVLVRETRLDPGDNVLVRGVVARDDAGERVIGPGPGVPFSVERWTRPTFVPARPGAARWRAALGSALLAGGAGGLLLG